MTELGDYSGSFISDMTYERFSKDVLLQLLSLHSEYIQKTDGFWYVAVKDRVGDDVAFESDMWVWSRLQIWELERVTRLFRIEGHDVAALFKTLQLSPWMRALKGEFELKSENHGIMTITHCPTLIGLEKEGEGRERRICNEWEPKSNRIVADFFNPKIEVNPLKLPPRKSKDDICCQWEFKLN